jgi:hypothetical protein
MYASSRARTDCCWLEWQAAIYSPSIVSQGASTLVTPIGWHTSEAFVTTESGCALGPATFPVYPPSPMGNALRERRRESGHTLLSAAKALGMRAADLSSIETGSATLSDEVSVLIEKRGNLNVRPQSESSWSPAAR